MIPSFRKPLGYGMEMLGNLRPQNAPFGGAQPFQPPQMQPAQYSGMEAVEFDPMGGDDPEEAEFDAAANDDITEALAIGNDAALEASGFDGLAGLEGMYTEVGDAPLSKEDWWMALAKAGFGTAASSSPHALQAVGQGALVGMDALEKMRRQRALERLNVAKALELDQYRDAMVRNAEERNRIAANRPPTLSNLGKLQQERSALVEQFGADDPRVKEYDAYIANAQQNPLATRIQQSDPMQLPDGSVVATRFDPKKGAYEYQGPDGSWLAVPDGSRPTTPGVASPLNRKQYETSVLAFQDETRALQKLDDYFATVKSADQGVGLLADKISAQFKTAFETGKLTPEQFAALEGTGKLQSLLGLFRTDVVGPGVMTEYDAQRVLQALGGDVGALRNKEVVEALLKDMYQSKRQRAEVMRRNILFSAPAYGDVPETFVIPEAKYLFGAPASPGSDSEPPSDADLVNKWLK